MKPPPSPTADWSEELRALHAHDMREIWDRQIAPHIWNLYHSQLDLYLGIAGGAPLDILDVGCAQATLALLLAERGHRVTAVDVRPAFLDYARTRYTHGRLELIAANALEDDIPGEYDLVFANQVVEHLVHPDRLIARLRDRLRPGGRLVMTTPNHDYVRNGLPSFRELGDPREWEHRQHSADGDGHFYAYRAEELAGVLRNCGLQRIEVRFFESPAINGHMKLRHVHGFVPPALLRAADRALLALPFVGRRLAHQLLVSGTKVRA